MYEQVAAKAGTAPFIDPRDLEAQPHAVLAALRRAHPVVRLGERQYMALRGADVIAMLTDPRTIQIEGADYVALNGIPEGATARFLRDFFLFDNGEAHKTKRRLFAGAFAPRALEAVQPRIRAVADAIVAELPRDETIDFVACMAARLPGEMIAAILGLPRFEVPYFTRHVQTIARAVSPVYPQADHTEIESAAIRLFAYVENHLLMRLGMPHGDLLSTLVADWQTHPTISFTSLVHQVLGLIVGGIDTTRVGFAALVALLAEHPAAWAAVKADPRLIPGAVAEALRYEPSVGSIARVTTAPVAIGDVTLPAGVVLRVSLLSALRDPDLYADPDRFDIRRSDHPRLHPVFGTGPHRCIGEMLARLEMQEGLAALISAVDAIEMDEPPLLSGFGGIRRITPMPLRVR
ncbi:cytochrome P450 [Pelagibius sp. 7325]|uniref:cytochrome P450 n=1 Tax=Pelagibius sp. 7325 TaxID=3131994 RepID=UPI0030EDD114